MRLFLISSFIFILININKAISDVLPNDLFSSVVGDQKFLRKENNIDSDSLIKYIGSLKWKESLI